MGTVWARRDQNPRAAGTADAATAEGASATVPVEANELEDVRYAEREEGLNGHVRATGGLEPAGLTGEGNGAQELSVGSPSPESVPDKRPDAAGADSTVAADITPPEIGTLVPIVPVRMPARQSVVVNIPTNESIEEAAGYRPVTRHAPEISRYVNSTDPTAQFRGRMVEVLRAWTQCAQNALGGIPDITCVTKALNLLEKASHWAGNGSGAYSRTSGDDYEVLEGLALFVRSLHEAVEDWTSLKDLLRDSRPGDERSRINRAHEKMFDMASKMEELFTYRFDVHKDMDDDAHHDSVMWRLAERGKVNPGHAAWSRRSTEHAAFPGILPESNDLLDPIGTAHKAVHSYLVDLARSIHEDLLRSEAQHGAPTITDVPSTPIDSASE